MVIFHGFLYVHHWVPVKHGDFPSTSTTNHPGDRCAIGHDVRRRQWQCRRGEVHLGEEKQTSLPLPHQIHRIRFFSSYDKHEIPGLGHDDGIIMGHYPIIIPLIIIPIYGIIWLWWDDLLGWFAGMICWDNDGIILGYWWIYPLVMTHRAGHGKIHHS